VAILSLLAHVADRANAMFAGIYRLHEPSGVNKYLAVWGGLLAFCGVLMYFLLDALGEESFFMGPVYIPPAQEVSLGVVLAGIIIAAAGAAFDWPKYCAISCGVAAKYFGIAALVNALAAAVFAAAMLVPPLELPILFTEWPGIYIAIAYSSFVGFGVFGLLAWGVMYQNLPNFFSRSMLDRRSVILQLLLSEVGVYVLSTFLFLGGYTGASLVHAGGVGPVFVGASMEFTDIPAAVSIFIVIVSVFLGALNIARAKNSTTQS